MRVYVASTYFELRHLRDTAEHVIQRLGHIPEMLDPLEGLSDEEVVTELRRRIAKCDCVVVLVGHGRGSTPKVTGLDDSSFTAVEYETASRNQLPILIFHAEGDPKPIRGDLPVGLNAAIRSENVWVERFKKGQLEAHLTKIFKDVNEFEPALTQALLMLSKTGSKDL